MDLLAPPNGHGGSDARALVLDRESGRAGWNARRVASGHRYCAVRGFDGQPGPTAAAFVANPFGAPGSRMFRTGRPRPVERRAHDRIRFAGGTPRCFGHIRAGLRTRRSRIDRDVSADQADSSEFVVAPAVCPVDCRRRQSTRFGSWRSTGARRCSRWCTPALAALLARRAGVDEIVIGTRVLTRQVDAGTGTVVTLRSLVDERESFVDLVERIRDRDAVEFDNAMAADGEAVAPGGRVTQIGLWARSFGEPRDATGRFDVEFRLEDTSSTLVAAPAISVAYRPRTVDLATVELLSRQLRTLLLQVGADPAVVVGDLAFESRGVLHGPPAGDPRSLGEILARTAERWPDRAALADGRVTLTYRDVDERSNRLAHKLITRGGAQPGGVVAVLLPRSINLVIALWAVAKTGAAYLPLDGDQPTDRTRGDVADRDVETAIGEPPRDLSARLNIDWIDVTAVDEDSSPVRLQSAVDEAAYVIFTSGSTGAPKGVVVTHRGLGALVSWAVDHYRVQPGSRVLQGYNCAFDAALLEVLLAVGGGACLIVAPDDVYAGIELQQFLVDQQVTHYLSTPAVLASVDPRQLPELQVVGVGGEALPTDLALRWSRDPGAPDRLLVNAYGPTEATVVATGAVVRDRVSIGVPVAGTSVLVLDARLRPVPTGGVGELYLFGSCLARGYLGSSAQTAERFVANPVSPGRMYRTGDLVCQRADGLLDFVGRVDHQVKLHGQRIELGEIDEAVRAIADVDNVATVLRTSAAGTDVLVSYIVPRTDVDVERLLRRLGRLLPSYMVPSSIVILPEMPVSRPGRSIGGRCRNRWLRPKKGSCHLGHRQSG